MAPFRLLRVARAAKGCSIVHCSAGIGRTGVIIGLELALQQILSGKPLNMVQIGQELRMKRMGSIQTDIQVSRRLRNISGARINSRNRNFHCYYYFNF